MDNISPFPWIIIDGSAVFATGEVESCAYMFLRTVDYLATKPGVGILAAKELDAR